MLKYGRQDFIKVAFVMFWQGKDIKAESMNTHLGGRSEENGRFSMIIEMLNNESHSEALK